MKTKAIQVGFLALLLTGAATLQGWAEEQVNPPVPAAPANQADKELEYTFGTVKSVSPSQIVITEFDYDTGEEKEMAYDIDPKVELNNAKSIQEITQGDEVDIDYKMDGEKKIAQVISVAKPLPAEGSGGES